MIFEGSQVRRDSSDQMSISGVWMKSLKVSRPHGVILSLKVLPTPTGRPRKRLDVRWMTGAHSRPVSYEVAAGW